MRQQYMSRQGSGGAEAQRRSPLLPRSPAPLLLTLLLWLTAVSPLPVYAQPIPLADYWQQLADLRQRVVAEPEAVAQRLREITAVSLPDGQTIAVDHSFLIRELQSGDGQRAAELLDALLQQHQSWPQPQFTAADREPLDEILQRPEFQYDTPPPSRLQQWWQDLVDRFWAFIARLLPDRSTPAGQLIGSLTTWLGGVLLVLVIAVALWNLLGGLVADARFVADDPAEEFLSAEGARVRAQQLAEGGDYRTAVRYLYLSALLLLEEHNLLRYDRSRTNREYLRSVAHRPELAAILQEVVEVFDRVWYGFQPLGQSDYDRYAAQVEALKRLR
ncbi:MAG: DUF4129 domain-containing protein [Chloroflexota bacterium]